MRLQTGYIFLFIFYLIRVPPHNLLIYMVARAGIEPATQGFSVLCSTD